MSEADKKKGAKRRKTNSSSKNGSEAVISTFSSAQLPLLADRRWGERKKRNDVLITCP